MLSAEHRLTIDGLNLFRDMQDESLYYYLPEDRVRIADEGRRLHFNAYIDSSVRNKDKEPSFNDDIERTGGFLTLEVELGPTLEELAAIKEKLSSRLGTNFKLVPVPFDNGNVKLVMFGSEGEKSEGENAPVKVWIAGSVKPSLFGRQAAVFSIRLGGKEAQLMWNMLQNGTQTQIAIVYDLEFMGVCPAYHLEISVDFKATEDYWNHHFELDADVSGDLREDKDTSLDSFSVVAGVDVDVMLRDLVNQGAIKVTQIDYTGKGNGGPLGADDPSGMKLVKELLSSSLFTVTAIPSEDYSVLAMDLKKMGGKNEHRQEKETEKVAEAAATQENSGSDEESVDDDEFAIEEAFAEKKSKSGKGAHIPPFRSDDDSPASGKTPRNDDAKPSADAISIDFNAKVGYALKHRKISEQVVRTFVFNKQEAKTFRYHPASLLTTRDTAFDRTAQVQLGRLGEGPFKQIDLEFRTAVKFEEYGISQIVVNFGYEKGKGLNNSVLLTDQISSQSFRFFSENFDRDGLDYEIVFTVASGERIIGSGPKTFTSEQKNTKNKIILVDWDDLKELKPLDILLGNLSFTSTSIIDATVRLYPSAEEDVVKPSRELISFKGTDLASGKFLIHEKLLPYRIETDYSFSENKFEGIKCNDSHLVVKYNKQQENQVLVNKPVDGMVKVYPILGADTFSNDILAVMVVFQKQGRKISSVNLTKSQYESYAILNYDASDSCPYQVYVTVVKKGENGKTTLPVQDATS